MRFRCSGDDEDDRLFEYELIWISSVFSGGDLTRIGVESEGTINRGGIRSGVWGPKDSGILSRMTFPSEIGV